MNELEAFWARVLEIMENDPEINSVSFNTWIKPLKPYAFTEEEICLSVDSDIVKNMVLSRYTERMKAIIKSLIGRELKITVTTARIEQNQPTLISDEKKDDDSARYTFDNFIVGNSNRFAQAAALAVTEDPAALYNPLFIYGGVGLGKTHLMHAIKNRIKSKNPAAKVAFVSSETFTNELINSFRDNKSEEFRTKYRSMDMLLVDDIQFIAGKTATEEEFFHTFNTLKEAGRQIVLTSDRPPHEIKTLAERLRSRFEWGLVCDIAPPDYETRIAILKQKAENEGVTVSDDILAFIAEKITSNIRELEGIFNRVVAFKGLVQEEITRDTVIKVLKDYSTDGKTIITPEYIVECCARFYSISPEKFYSTSQKKDVSFARQVSFYLCKEILDISLQKIGQVFGRDHTTVLYGVKKIEKDMQNDPVLKNNIDMLIKDIKPDK